MGITERIDAITHLPADRYATTLAAPKSLKIELTARCNYSCLRGDMPVDTIYGPIPIRELADNFDTVPVYTYKDGEVFISDAVDIRKYGENDELVRVHFDDGTHIDCTPDHRFLLFRSRGATPGCEEWAEEARNLKPGDRLRAYRENETGAGYITICAGRHFRRKRYRMVMDYMAGRKVDRREHVHHIDRDITNDQPGNLELFASAADHFAHHPEIAERMRLNNPAKNMTPEWRENLRISVTGKTRSLESRIRYRESKLGEKNPNYKDGRTCGEKSRIQEVNHKVVSVECLVEREDTYCLTVPETGWFFANKVLVKNCGFCARGDKLRQQGEMDRGLYSRLIREFREAGIEELGLFYLGESFMVKWLPEAIAEAKDVGFPYVFLTTNGSLSTRERTRACFQAGLDSLKFSWNFSDPEQFARVTGVKAALYDTCWANVADARIERDEEECRSGHRCGLYASYIEYDGEQAERMQPMVEWLTTQVDEVYALPLYNQASYCKTKIQRDHETWQQTAGNMGRVGALVPPLPCWALFAEGHVSYDGKLTGCCFAHTPDFDFGDLREMSFMDAWNSPAAQALRDASLRKDVRGTACEACVAWN